MCPLDEKARYVTDLSYSGYVPSGAEKKGDKENFPEVFTIFPDVPEDDARVRDAMPSSRAAAVDKPHGVGAHTDYGFFVISSQTDDQEGLFIRLPVEGETRLRTWIAGESMSGFREHDEP